MGTSEQTEIRSSEPEHLRAPVVIRHAEELGLDEGLRLAPGLTLIGPAELAMERPGGAPVVLALHSCGVVDGQFVRNATDLQTVVDARADWSGDRLGGATRGVMTAYLWRPEEQVVEILPDPWGGLVHHYRDADVELFSSDLGAVVHALSLLGRRPRRSLAFCLEVAAVGSGGLHPSSYEGVQVLDVLHHVRVTADGAQILRYSVAEEILTPFDSYEEGLAAIRAEIEGNIRAVVQAGQQDPDLALIAHLTGGLDTRMILAATRHLGLGDRFAYLSLGPSTMPDRRIAEQLAAEFDLTMTEYRGTQPSAAPASIGEMARWPLDFSHGLLTTGPHAFQSSSDTVILSGGFGGYLKGNYSKALLGLEPDRSLEMSGRLARLLWGEKAFSADPEVGLYTQAVVDERIARFHELRLQAEDLGLSPAAALDWLFIRVRNRYFLAETTKVWNDYVHRFDPLYCLSGARLALHLSTQERSANVIVLDTLRHWDSRLLCLPFDHPRVTPEYVELRGPVPTRRFRDPQAQPRIDDRPAPQPVEGASGHAPATPEMVAEARRLQAPLWQVQHLATVRATLQRIIRGLPRPTRKSVFNSQQVHGLLYWQLDHRGLVRQVHNLHGVLQWYAADPLRVVEDESADQGPWLESLRRAAWHLRQGGPRQLLSHLSRARR